MSGSPGRRAPAARSGSISIALRRCSSAFFRSRLRPGQLVEEAAPGDVRRRPARSSGSARWRARQPIAELALHPLRQRLDHAQPQRVVAHAHGGPVVPGDVVGVDGDRALGEVPAVLAPARALLLATRRDRRWPRSRTAPRARACRSRSARARASPAPAAAPRARPPCRRAACGDRRRARAARASARCGDWRRGARRRRRGLVAAADGRTAARGALTRITTRLLARAKVFGLPGRSMIGYAAADPQEERPCPTKRRRKPSSESTTRSSTCPSSSGPRTSTRSTSRKLRAKTGLRDARPGVHEHGVDEERDHVPRRREGHPPLPRHPDRAARREVDASSRLRTCSSTASCRTRPSSTRFSTAAHASLADPRGHEALLRRLPVDGPPDGDAVGDGAARCRATTRRRST